MPYVTDAIASYGDDYDFRNVAEEQEQDDGPAPGEEGPSAKTVNEFGQTCYVLQPLSKGNEMPKTTDVEVWICVDEEGNTATGPSVDDARQEYEDEIGSLAECNGFRVIRATITVPLPEVEVIAVSAKVRELSTPTAFVEPRPA